MNGLLNAYMQGLKRIRNLPSDVWPVSQWWIGGTVLESDCVIAYQPLYAPSLAQSYINLANPGTYNAVPLSTAPGWDIVNGWIGDGTDKRLETGYTPANTTHTMMAQYASAAGGMICGLNASTNTRLYLWPHYNTTQIAYAEGNLVLVNNAVRTGNMAISGQQGYFDGVAEGAEIGAWSAAPARSIQAVGSNSASLVPSNYYTGKLYAVAVWNRTLTPTEIAARAAAMAAMADEATTIAADSSDLVLSPYNWRQV